MLNELKILSFPSVHAVQATVIIRFVDQMQNM